MSYPPPPAAYPPAPGSGATGAPTRYRGRTPRILGWVLLGLAVASFIAGFVVIGVKTLSPVNDFKRVDIPTSSNGVPVQFDRTGKWVAYYEASNVDSDIDQVPAVGIAIQSPSGDIQRLTTPFGNRSDGKIDIYTYDYNGHKGVTLYEFDIKEPGRYLVATQGNDLTAPDAKIAFGEDVTGAAIAGLVLIGIGVALGVVAVILLIVGYVKLSNHKGELRAAASGPYWGGAPPPGYAGAPGYGGAPSYGAPQGFPPPSGYQPPPPPGYQPPDQPNFGEQPPSSGSS